MDKKFEQFKSMIEELDHDPDSIVTDFTSWFLSASPKEQQAAYDFIVIELNYDEGMMLWHFDPIRFFRKEDWELLNEQEEDTEKMDAEAEFDEFKSMVAEIDEKGIAMVEKFTSWFMGASEEEQKEVFSKLSRKIEQEYQENTVINLSGAKIVIDQAKYLMDDDLREDVYASSEYDTEQEFFTAYELAHQEKYGELWSLSRAHPEY